MFKNKAFMTVGYQNDIPDNIKEFIAHIIGKCSQMEDADYLQVFKLHVDPNNDQMQVIEHTQEQPMKRMVYTLSGDFDKVIDQKVYVIDDTSHHTCLLASEY